MIEIAEWSFRPSACDALAIVDTQLHPSTAVTR